MAKKSMLMKTKRSERLIAQYDAKRKELLAIARNPELPLDERMAAGRRLARIPLRAAKVRYRNRCLRTGRPRAYIRKFKISRIALRELAPEGKLPGVTKSSW